MGDVTNQIAIVFGVLVACFAGPAAALFVLVRRKAKARQSRRSPIGIALLHGPGHSPREQLDEAHNDLTWDLVLLMVVPLLALALFLAQSHLRGLPAEQFNIDHVVVAAEGVFAVETKGFTKPNQGRGRVRVFSGKELAGLLKSRGTQALTTQDVQRIAHQVEQRCRTVTPLYAQEPKAS